MQTKSNIARIAAALAIAVLLPLAILVVVVHGGKNPLAQPGLNRVAVASDVPANVTPAQAQKVAEEYGRVAMSFEPNQGQSAPEVQFLSRGAGYDLFLTGQEAVLSVRRSTAKRKASPAHVPTISERREAQRSQTVSVVRMKLDGANPSAQVAGLASQDGKINYFIGNDPKKWHTDIPTYGQVKYSAVYPGIDLVYYGNQKQLEYDFIVAPGADPKAIAFNVKGASAVRVDKKGNLLLKTTGGDVTFQKPFVYQEDAGQRREIAGNYVIDRNREVRFALGAYDPAKALTIDPSVLIYSTYLGGSGANGDQALGIGLDASGDVFVAGTTSSADFPTANNYGTPLNIASGVTAAFVSEINPTGTQFLYSTYLGGSGNAAGSGDGANAIAVGKAGNIYVTGYTSSMDFPTTASGLITTAPASVAQGGTAFVTRLFPATSGTGQLAYSTYLGGTTYPASGSGGAIDEGFGMATDGNGNAFVVGVTSASDFPTLNPIVSTLNSARAAGNAFTTVINTTLSGQAALTFSTYLGGSGGGSVDNVIPFGDEAAAVTRDSTGLVYVTGSTSSTDFAPTTTGGTPCGDASFATGFLVKLNLAAAPPASTFSTCLGGAQGSTVANSLTVAPDGTIVVGGYTFASDFTVTNTIPPNVPSASESLAFVRKYNTSGGTAIAYSTVFGGSDGDGAYGVATDSTGNIYVTGYSNSPDFPITQGALQETKNNPDGATFIAKLNPAGGGASDLIYGTYFGGAGQGQGYGDTAFGIVVSPANNAYIAGQASSLNSGATPFPITSGAKQTTQNSVATNAFIAELPLTPTISVSPISLDFGTQVIGATTPAQFVTVTNNTTTAINLTIPPSFVGTNPADFAYSASPTTPCGASLAGGSMCMVGVTFTASVAGPESATLNIVDSDDTMDHPLAVSLTGAGQGAGPSIGLSPTTLTFAGQLIGTSSTAQSVTVTNNGTTALTISSIMSSSGSFTETDSCTDGAIPAAGTCTIMVTFTPASGAMPGAISGTFTVTSNATNNPQTFAVSGTVWDYSLTVPATATLNKGGNTTFAVGINGTGGFAGNVGVACSSASSAVATCAVNPAMGVPGGSVTVTVTNSGMVAPMDLPSAFPPVALRQIVFALIAIMLLFMIPMTRTTRARLGLAAAMLVFVVVAGCSGSSTPKSTTLTITGSSGSAPTKTYTVNVTVN
jgi:Abnormal spindle-like microcephaly-assoc'd, ASPM-SPD-2-Hydin/Beta-propeller repeat